MGTLRIVSFPLGRLQTNCYVVTDREESFCLVIDPGENPELVCSFLSGRHVDYILLTHAHHDHIAGLYEMKAYTDSHVAVHHTEASWLTDPVLNLSAGLESEVSAGWPDVLLQGNEVIRCGLHSVKVLHTPGHSPGSVSYVIDGYVFSGDTLMAGLVGPTEIPGGNRDVLKRSVKNTLFSLPEATVVLPGHGEQTTIGYEKEHNLLPKIQSFYP